MSTVSPASAIAAAWFTASAITAQPWADPVASSPVSRTAVMITGTCGACRSNASTSFAVSVPITTTALSRLAWAFTRSL